MSAEPPPPALDALVPLTDAGVARCMLAWENLKARESGGRRVRSGSPEVDRQLDELEEAFRRIRSGSQASPVQPLAEWGDVGDRLPGYDVSSPAPPLSASG